jgi:predicted ATPase
MTGKPVLTALGQANRHHRRVFLAPPWPEIYKTDPERRHGLDVAMAEYSRLPETLSVVRLRSLDVANGGSGA